MEENKENEKKAPIQKKDLLKLYELAVSDQHIFAREHQNRIHFHAGLISALLVATVAGLIKSSHSYHFVALLLGPALIFTISHIAVGATFRLYQCLLEAITMRAKIEQELGLTKSRITESKGNNEYWQSEQIVPYRHIKSRRDFQSSQAFVLANLSKGYQRWTRYLFRLFQLISIFLFFVLLILAIYKYVSK